MKTSTLYLYASACLLFASCGDEESTQTPKENIFKNLPQKEMHFQDPTGASSSNAAPQTVAVPFDFGLSAVFGAGALAAVRMARKRRQEEQEA